MLTIILEALKETIVMVFLSGLVTAILGIPLGILLYTTQNKNFLGNKFLHCLLQWPSSLLNALPYLVIIVACTPLINWLTAHAVPANLAAIFPLCIATIPLYGILTYQAISKLPEDLLATAESLGATPNQALLRMYLPEIMPNLIDAFAEILKRLISYSTISGLFGAGGIGYLLLQKGYENFNLAYVVTCALLLVMMFQLIQYANTLISENFVKN